MAHPPLTAERRSQLLTFLKGLDLTPEPTLDLAPLDEALTHTSAGLAVNHERLEFLGDAVLRLAASEFLERSFPELSVGQRSALRAQLVSDRWLADLGERCGIELVLRIGTHAAGDNLGRATLRAEACEAVIGALYRLWGGLEPVDRWLSPHWHSTALDLVADPARHNWKSALQEWSQAERLGLPHYESHEVSRRHGDSRRFHCRVGLGEGAGAAVLGEGWGPSRRGAEQEAAQAAVQGLRTQGRMAPAGGARPLRPAPGS